MKLFKVKKYLLPGIILITVAILMFFFLLIKSRNRGQSLADLYYDGKCFRINNTGGHGGMSKSEGFQVFTGDVENVCNHIATLQRIRIYTYNDDKYKNLFDDTRTFVPSESPQTINPGEKISFSYTLHFSGEELKGFHFYKLVGED